MAEVVINYESLYEILRLEKSRTELQKLDSGFFKGVLDYLRDKQAILESQENKESIFASGEVDKTRIQIRNIQRILKELYERRESKIIQFALFSSRNFDSNIDISAMLPEEKGLFDSLSLSLNKSRESVLFNLLKNKEPLTFSQDSGQKQKDLKRNQEIEDSNSNKNGPRTVRFKCQVPEFVGTDLIAYGPFEKDDTASLPEEVIVFLERNSQAEVI